MRYSALRVTPGFAAISAGRCVTCNGVWPNLPVHGACCGYEACAEALSSPRGIWLCSPKLLISFTYIGSSSVRSASISLRVACPLFTQHTQQPRPSNKKFRAGALTGSRSTRRKCAASPASANGWVPTDDLGRVPADCAAPDVPPDDGNRNRF